MMKHNTLLVCIGTTSQIILDYPVILQTSEYVALLTTTLLLYPQVLNCVSGLSEQCNI